MSAVLDLQSAEGVMARARPTGNLIKFGPTVPTDATAGYAPGCPFFKSSGTADACIYVNNGSNTSCAFVPFTTGVLATSAEINRVADLSTREVAAGAASLTVTAALHSDKTILLDQATGTAVTLPAMTGSGAKYRFVCSVATSGGSQVITATGAHLFGNILVGTDGALAAGTLWVPGMAMSPAGSTTITLNGGTTGGRKGDWIEIEDVATSIGIVRGSINASGTEATPFA
jgi:hypothetical protein